VERRIVPPFIVACAFVLGALFSSQDLKTPHREVVFGPSREGEEREHRAETGNPGEALRWQITQRAVPTGVIPENWRERAYAHITEHNRTESFSALSWQEIGPNNIAGRIRSMAIDPINVNVIYAGSVSGGVFKTVNGGTSWATTNDFASNLSIGALAIDPTNTSIIYAGTGEGFYNGDALRGAGVLKSTDGGATWTLQTNFTGGSFPYYINDLYLRPDAPSTVFAASNTGLYRTTNGGTSWTFIHQGNSSVRATQIVAHSGAPATFFVMYGNFSADGIYKTTNGGTSFTKQNTGLPTSGYYRVSLAIAPSNSQVVYACYSSTSHITRGIFRTTNGGTSWDSLATPIDPLTGGTHLAGQGWYNNVIAVDPANANTVYTGGVNLFKSVNGGTSWTMISNWYSGAGYQYVHADQHEMVFQGSSLFFCNDGGVFRSVNGGSTFTELSSGLATIQFYSGAVHPTLDITYGGTQDNGTLKATTAPTWTPVFGGDGGATAVDFITPTTVYTEYVYLNFQKSTNSGTSWSRMMSGIPTSGGGQFDGTSDRCLFIAPFTMDPSSSQRIAAGTYRVFLTTNAGTLWSAIGGDLTGDGPGPVGSFLSSISAIGIAKTNPAVLYVGTSGTGSSARIQVTTNTGTNWTNVTAAPLPPRYVTRIAIDPNNADRAWAIYSGYNSSTPGTPGHVFLTTNRGTSWANASGNLPDIPANAAVVNPANANHVVIGTDLGIFETTNGGTTWTQQNTGLANVQISDLDLRVGDNVLFAATHGRGMFRSSGPLTDVEEQQNEIAMLFQLGQNYPNPFNPSTTIPFTLSRESRINLSLYNLAGQHITDIASGEFAAGSHAVSLDASSLASGVYIYRLTAHGLQSSKRLLLLR